MLVDARTVPPDEILSSEVCIVGGGAAGIAVALGLVDHPARVVLLESGGLRREDSSQALAKGVTTGRPYYPLDECRLRMLGGSSGFWGGWCRPLDAIDFEERDWVPHSGWPFGKEHLVPFYQRAQEVCRLGPYEYEAAYWRRKTEVDGSSARPELLKDTVFQIAPVRFGRQYRDALQKAQNVRVLLHASALDIEMDASQRTAARIRVAGFGGVRFSVAARAFILAAGGIENPRLLLASQHDRSCGIGNELDLVGRFFTEHLHVPIAHGETASARPWKFYRVHRAHGTRIRGMMRVSADTARRERLYGCGLTLHNADDPHDVLRPSNQPASYESMRLLMTSVRRRERPEKMLHHVGNVLAGIDTASALAYRKLVTPATRSIAVGLRAEQAPNPNSRVTLDDRRDRFNVPMAKVDWQLTSADLENVQRVRGICLDELNRRSRRDSGSFTADEDDRWLDGMYAAAHHMGTTRMHHDPRQGVVDEHCRVHGTSNVFVAGSSVFPTAGWAPPTLTIVALALRLSDHVKDVIA